MIWSTEFLFLKRAYFDVSPLHPLWIVENASDCCQGNFPHSAYYPPFRSNFLHIPFRILPSAFRMPQFHILPTAYVYVACCRLLLLCVSNLRRVFSKCSFRWHSAYFHSAFYPSFRRKNPHRIFRKLPHDNFPHSAFRVPQNTPSLLQTSKILDSSENHVVSFSVSGILRELTGLRAGNKRVGVSTSRPVTDTCSTAPATTILVNTQVLFTCLARLKNVPAPAVNFLKSMLSEFNDPTVTTSKPQQLTKEQ